MFQNHLGQSDIVYKYLGSNQHNLVHLNKLEVYLMELSN